MNGEKIKILVLHTSVGHGMKVTALNMAEQLSASSEFEVRIEDFQSLEKGFLTNTLEKIYTYILEKIPSLWGFLYNSKLILFITLPLRKFLFSFKSQKILQILREFQPAIVISVETVPSGIVAYLKSKGLYRGKLVVAFSDYHVHPFWLYDEADLYLCNISEQAETLKNLKIPDQKIAVTGAVVSARFLEPLTRQQALEELSLLTTMPVVLLTNGSLVRMETKNIFLRLLRSPKSFQIVVLCGSNPKLKEELEKISPPSHHPVKILSYVNNMHTYMTAASVLVGKTGGPTMVEAVVKKLPIILTDVRPGHEMLNLEYLLKYRVAEYARIPGEAVFLVEKILEAKSKNFDEAYEKIVKPQNSVSLVEALSRVRPRGLGVKVVSYQQ